MSVIENTDRALIPGALEHEIVRTLDGGAEIRFESAPYGWLKADGTPREKDHRAYYYRPQVLCPQCDGTGRAPSLKRANSTVKCPPCAGTGDCKRERYVSVTTMLDAILPKGGLPIWAERMGAIGAIQAVRLGEIDPDVIFDEDIVPRLRLLKLGAEQEKKLAADRGLDIHALLEEYMRTGDAPRRPENQNHWGYYQSLCAWLLAVDPHPEAVEQLVCDPSISVAGRYDLLATCDGLRVRWDAKTNADSCIWPSAHVQLAAYERCAIASGEEPSDLQQVVVFAEDGSFRQMACAAGPREVEVAFAYYEALKPITSICESHNRAEKKARRS